jgi:hypothetical protein
MIDKSDYELILSEMEELDKNQRYFYSVNSYVYCGTSAQHFCFSGCGKTRAPLSRTLAINTESGNGNSRFESGAALELLFDNRT